MFQDKSFRKRAIPLVILSFIFMYFFAGLQNDHLNVITPYLEETYGWTATQITNPVTLGGLVAILFYLLTPTAFIKIGIRKVVTVVAVIIAACVIGLGFSNGNYVVYFITLFVVRSLVVCLQLNGLTLCTNWFLKYRGRMLGIVTSGPPLFTATGTAILTMGMNSVLGMSGTYLTIGLILIICTIFYFWIVRDTPEELGLTLDGEPAQNEDNGEKQEESIVISLKELLSYKESWAMILLFAVLQFVLIVYIAFYVADLRYVGATEAVYLPALTVGALCAFPMGLLVGTICDRFGVHAASFFCIIFASLPPIIYLFTKPTSFVLCALIALGGAGLGGSFGSVMPSMLCHYFGRARYNAVNRWLMTFVGIAASCSTYYMSYFLEHEQFKTAFAVILVLVAAALASILYLMKFGKVHYTD